MKRIRLAVSFLVVVCMAAASSAAVYDNVYWVGGSGEWTGDAFANPAYSMGHWSTDPIATSGLPAKYVFGRNDGIRVNQVVGPGSFDLDRVPCANTLSCSGGTQLGTDVYISGPVNVTYNGDFQLVQGDDAPDRFNDFRYQPDPNFPGTPTLNLSDGAILDFVTTVGGHVDGDWLRWNGAELNVDNAILRRRGDKVNGFPGGAFMLASYYGYANSLQTIKVTNGGRIENEGQLWFGISGLQLGSENKPGISVIMTINDGHLDLTGGDEYALDNDGLPLRADLAFIYDHKPDGDTDRTDDETFIINFTGPGTITVDGDVANPIDGDTTTGGGGIRVARQTGYLSGFNMAEYEGGNEQKSYQDLWDLGILRANGLSGITGANFDSFFRVTGFPGGNDYTLTSLVPETSTILTTVIGCVAVIGCRGRRHGQH